MKGIYNKKDQSFHVTLKKARHVPKGFLGFGNTNKPKVKKIRVPDHMKDMFKDGEEYTIPRITPDTRN